MIVGDEVVGALSVWRNTVGTLRRRDDACSRRSPSRRRSHCATSSCSPRSRAGRPSWRARWSSSRRSPRWARRSARRSTPTRCSTRSSSHAVELSGTDGGSLMEYDEATGLFRVRTRLRHERRRRSMPCGPPRSTSTARGSAGPRGPGEVLQIPDLDRARQLDPHLAVLHAAGWRSLVADPARAARPGRRCAGRAAQDDRRLQRRDVRPARRPSPASRRWP